MSVPWSAAVAAVAMIALVTPAMAQSTSPVFAPVAVGDPAIGNALLVLQAPLRFIDGDADGRAAGDEPAYWDLDDSNSVTVGDLRLRAFGAHAAGATIAVTDADAGRLLTGSAAWFGAAGGQWFADLDASRSITVGDARMADGRAVASGASDLGQALSYPSTAQSPGRASVVDADNDQRRDRGEAVYLDLDAANSPSQPAVSAGDLVLVFRSAASGTPGTGGTGLGQGTDGSSAGSGNDGGWRTLDAVLLLLGLANLAGLVFVAMRVRDASRPRNPFK